MSELVVEKREILGKKVKNLRDEGFIPGELYGYGVDNTHISIPVDKFRDIYREAGTSSVVDLILDGDVHKVLIHDVQIHPISEEFLNIDFYQVNMKEKTTANIPLEFVGESSAVKDKGGVLITVMDEIEVEALPNDLPHSIEVDISVLVDLDTSLSVANLPKSELYTYTVEPEAAVLSVSSPREEVEEEPVDELSPDDVIVEGEEKREAKEGEGEEKSAGNEENQTDEKA